MVELRFVFDQHVNARALKQLVRDGIDAVHAADAGLAEADDADIMAWAAAERRIMVTRNYRDFAPLAKAYARHGRTFPGVLFLATSIRQSDTGRHVHALHEWIRLARERGANPVENGVDWLS